jgi:hypothetical protein
MQPFLNLQAFSESIDHDQRSWPEVREWRGGRSLKDSSMWEHSCKVFRLKHLGRARWSSSSANLFKECLFFSSLNLKMSLLFFFKFCPFFSSVNFLMMVHVEKISRKLTDVFSNKLACFVRQLTEGSFINKLSYFVPQEKPSQHDRIRSCTSVYSCVDYSWHGKSWIISFQPWT